MKQKVVALIPARYAASRFPGKLMQVLKGKTVIRRTFEAVQQSAMFDQVVVVCDDDSIEQEIRAIGGTTFRSTREFESGSDRIAEAAAQFEADVIVNVQGDEPFIDQEALQKLIFLFLSPEVQMASLMMPIHDPEKFMNPNCVKVVVDGQNRALYFSRAPIPFLRDGGLPATAFQHIGIYAFRKKALLEFTQLPPSPLEQCEKLENLRMLENGWAVHMVQVESVGISIDTPEDFLAAELFLEQHGE